MYIVARDGSGDFTSLQEAVRAVPAGRYAPTILILRMDAYPERVTVDRDNLRIVGEARDRTVLEAPDGGDACTLRVTGKNVSLENLTVRGGAEGRCAVHNCVFPENRGKLVCAEPEVRLPTWFLCGDSTMADYPPEKAPMTGWGQKLQELVRGEAFVENCAVNGRSSKSFVAEMRLNFVELCLRPGDRLIVSFSHNDEKPDPLRCTSPRMTFPEYLNMYIDAARRQGAEAILATPIARRLFDAQGRLLATHGEYPAAIRDLAEIRGVRLAELERASMAAFQQAGPEGTKALFCHVPAGQPNWPDGCADNSHLQEAGAALVAGLFLDLLRGGKAAEGVYAGSGADLSALIGLEDSVVDR